MSQTNSIDQLIDYLDHDTNHESTKDDVDTSDSATNPATRLVAHSMSHSAAHRPVVDERKVASIRSDLEEIRSAMASIDVQDDDEFDEIMHTRRAPSEFKDDGNDYKSTEGYERSRQYRYKQQQQQQQQQHSESKHDNDNSASSSRWRGFSATVESFDDVTHTQADSRWRGFSVAGAPSFNMGNDEAQTAQQQQQQQPNLYKDSSEQLRGVPHEPLNFSLSGDDDDSAIGLEPDFNQLRSYQSRTMPASSRGANKAVLESLRAMQDKVRKMEAARQASLQQVAELSEMSSRTLHENSGLREAEARVSTAAKNKQRILYERLVTEKGEVDVRVAKVVERCNKSNQELEEARRACLEARNSRDVALEIFDSANEENETREVELSKIQEEESRLTSLISEYQVQSTSKEKLLKSQLQKENELLVQRKNKREEIENKMRHVNRVLGVVLSLNQELVEESSSPTKKSHLSQRQPLAHKNNGFLEGGDAAAEAAFKANVSIAASRLLDPHGKKLGMSLQNELRRVYDVLLADFTSDGSQGINPSNLAGASGEPRQREIDAYPNANAAAVGMAQLGINSVMAASHLQGPSTPQRVASTSASHSEAAQKISQTFIENALTPPRYSPNRAAGNVITSPVGALKDATSMIESEFNQLNLQYINLLNSVKSGEEEDIGAMLNLISNIQSKGEQLNIMKQTMMNKNVRMPVFSPEASKRKAAALSILRDYRELSSDSNGDSWNF
ncbi:hypothetical protein TrLO_g9708 [Triparma laevis f. longispina]|uniref:Uncharacterized protein n=1 Tax=Triparma laevis f. longispina TaxID=1714387 RepID=A0A9W6ZVZ5_9STRA|nr:hypothetical protein TrLO_g9708 [Triparma laevis f. longispina]